MFYITPSGQNTHLFSRVTFFSKLGMPLKYFWVFIMYLIISYKITRDYKVIFK